MMRLLPLGLLLLIPAAWAQEDAAGVKLFEEKIAPLLAARCYKCHSAQAPKPKGGLLLDARAAALKGGDTGPALVPGKPEASLLLKAVRWEDPDLKMPPKEKMPAAEADLLKEWISKGAPWSAATARAQAGEEDHRR